jgi:limonene-1,2-epoxide hydrolase
MLCVPSNAQMNDGDGANWFNCTKVRHPWNGRNDYIEFLRHYRSGPLVDKWHNYFDVYDRYFAPLRMPTRTRPIRFLEIGVQSGGSIKLWQHYFGKNNLHYTGIDINKNCLQFAEPGVDIVIGDQSSPEFWAEFARAHGDFDVILDDGGHSMQQQIVTFKEAWPLLRFGGVFMTEDLHTSYWRDYGGGLGNADSFVSFTKTIVDDLNAWHWRGAQPSGLSVRNMNEIRAMSFYESMVVFEKSHVRKPQNGRWGDRVIPYK